MAYDKKYPDINDEILTFDKNQEDRTEKAFQNTVIELSTTGGATAVHSPKLIYFNGVVRLTGVVKNNESGDRVLTIPEKYRPKYPINFPQVKGSIQVTDFGPVIVWGESRDVFLDTVSWYLE